MPHSAHLFSHTKQTSTHKGGRHPSCLQRYQGGRIALHIRAEGSLNLPDYKHNVLPRGGDVFNI